MNKNSKKKWRVGVFSLYNSTLADYSLASCVPPILTFQLLFIFFPPIPNNNTPLFSSKHISISQKHSFITTLQNKN